MYYASSVVMHIEYRQICTINCTYIGYMLKFLHIFARVLVFKDARKQFLADGM